MIIIIIIIVIVEIVTYGENLVNLKLTLPFSPYAISAPFFYATNFILILFFYKIPSSNYFAVSIVKFIYPMLDITLFSYYVYLVIMIIIILKLCLPVVCTGPYTKKIHIHTHIFASGES